MDLSLNWQGLGAICAISLALWSLAMVLIRNNLRKSFVEIESFEALDGRMTVVETRIVGSPTHDDIKSLGSRLGSMETATATNTAMMVGVGQGLARVERMVEMLVKNELDGEHK